MLGLSAEESKRLRELQFEYNRRRFQMMDIIESQGQKSLSRICAEQIIEESTMDSWKDSSKELPISDGSYECTNDPENNMAHVGICTYNGYGFKIGIMYKSVKYWRNIAPTGKRYGKITKEWFIMKKRILKKTIVHLRDDKGWEKEEERDGHWECGNTFRIRKYRRQFDIPELLTKNIEFPHLESLNSQDYVFELVKCCYEDKDDYFVKHIYFEMR
jgi:hypothetical protein